MGKNSLAERLDCSIQEAEDIIQGLYKSFPKLREYVDKQSQYPLDHCGFINTMLGDKLQLREFVEYLPKAKTDRERNNIIARINRLGVNLPIQGGTSTIMAAGFDNNIRESLKNGWNDDVSLTPIIVVHDSNTNYVPVSKVYDIRKFYDVNFTDHCSSVGPKIRLLFDLLVGYSYERASTLKQIDENTIEFTGSSYQIIGLYDKIMNCKTQKSECDKTREEILSAANYIVSPLKRFIVENGACMVKDTSKITVRFKRIV